MLELIVIWDIIEIMYKCEGSIPFLFIPLVFFLLFFDDGRTEEPNSTSLHVCCVSHWVRTILHKPSTSGIRMAPKEPFFLFVEYWTHDLSLEGYLSLDSLTTTWAYPLGGWGLRLYTCVIRRWKLWKIMVKVYLESEQRNLMPSA